MITTQEKTTQVDDLLDKMAESLQLDNTRKERMTTAYEAVKDWIESDEKFFKPFRYDFYPHGSVRTLTTVRPMGKDEFDLDVAVHLKADYAAHTPARIYQELKRRLGEHGIYKSMLETKNRCLRLNYAGDFHMDILPGIQQYSWDENMLMVPDRELGSWVSSSPRGYANWFIHRANLVKESLLEKALRAENLPVDKFANKKPLQRAVQLIKRYRDMYFEKDGTYRTSSIILTTLAGQLYNGQDSIFDTVDGIVEKMTINNRYNLAQNQVVNPVNPAEDFTDKWKTDPGYYEAFRGFVGHLYNEWQQLKKEQGVITESRIFKGLFGDDVFSKAQQQQVQQIEALRQSRQLGINRSTGILSSLAAGTSAIRPNTFFGD